jgi:hypothetical protein
MNTDAPSRSAGTPSKTAEPVLPFSPTRPPVCINGACKAIAITRMGDLDVCGRHTNWAVDRQVGEMQSLVLPVGRYQRIT